MKTVTQALLHRALTGAGIDDKEAYADSKYIWLHYFNAQTADFEDVLDVLLTFMQLEDDSDSESLIDEGQEVQQVYQDNYVSYQRVGVAEKYSCTMGA